MAGTRLGLLQRRAAMLLVFVLVFVFEVVMVVVVVVVVQLVLVLLLSFAVCAAVAVIEKPWPHSPLAALSREGNTVYSLSLCFAFHLSGQCATRHEAAMPWRILSHEALAELAGVQGEWARPVSALRDKERKG